MNFSGKPFNFLKVTTLSVDFFLESVKNGDKKALEHLVSRGAVNASLDDCGRTALIFASLNGDTAAIKYLLNNGANKKIKDASDRNAVNYALEYAVREGDEDSKIPQMIDSFDKKD